MGLRSSASGDCRLPSGCIISSGDTLALIRAINEANATPEPDTITLQPGIYTLTSINYSDAEGDNGLPRIETPITIIGAGSEGTVIERSDAAGVPPFRLLFVSAEGQLTVEGVTLRGGSATVEGGGSLRNHGGTVVLDAVIIRSSVAPGGGAIWNEAGEMTLIDTSVSGNKATGQGGGIGNSGLAMLTLRQHDCQRKRSPGTGRRNHQFWAIEHLQYDH